MTPVHPLLLGGLLLVGIPVLLHLIMRQKPKRLQFPAFRFLVQRHHSNQRKLRLRHLLLLLLRMLLIAVFCMALAFGSGQPVAVVLVVDTSPSMEYKVGDKSRLDEARRQALQLLDDLPDNSQVAVFDTGEPDSDGWTSIGPARDKINKLKIRYGNQAITSKLASAYDLLAKLPEGTSRRGGMPRLYIFSDRTRACWDSGRVADLVRLRDRLNLSETRGLFADVGAPDPINLAVADLALPWSTIPGGEPAIFRATVQATGKDFEEAEVQCRIDGKTLHRKVVSLKAGGRENIVFEVQDLPAGLHRAEIALAAPDSLTYANARFATIDMAGARQVLTISDDPNNAELWKRALADAFPCTVVSTEQAKKMSYRDLANFKAICLLDVKNPVALWERLARYVAGGGGLAIVPGGEEVDRAAYNDNEFARGVMPATLNKLVSSKAGSHWEQRDMRSHPITEQFKEWAKLPRIHFVAFPRSAFKYWDMETRGNGSAIVSYDDASKRPALVVGQFDPDKVRGRVVLFTTPMDGRKLSKQDQREWNDYNEDPFYFSLANVAISYLAGDAEGLNFLTGQTIRVTLPASPRFPNYALNGPGINSPVIISRAGNQGQLTVSQAELPGSYSLDAGDDKATWQGGFSQNVPPEECQLSRVPAEDIEKLLGKGSVLVLGPDGNLRDALQKPGSQLIRLFPWLMIGLLLLLALENLLANKFYRKQSLPEKAGTALTPEPDGQAGKEAEPAAPTFQLVTEAVPSGREKA